MVWYVNPYPVTDCFDSFSPFFPLSIDHQFFTRFNFWFMVCVADKNNKKNTINKIEYEPMARGRVPD